jgi:uncharacterized protein CbrC (UPF0167 family)
MIRIVLTPPYAADAGYPANACVCCGARYAVRRRGLRLFDGRNLDGDICPDCVLLGPAGAAETVRRRISSFEEDRHASAEAGSSLVRKMERRVGLLERTPSFPLAARQAAVRETRERR